MKIEKDKGKEKDSHFPNSPWTYVIILFFVITLASGGSLYYLLKSPGQIIYDTSDIMVESQKPPVIEEVPISTEEITEPTEVVEIIPPVSLEPKPPAEEPEKPSSVSFVRDILEQGQSKEYLIGETEYKVNIVSIENDIVKFNINEGFIELKKGETLKIGNILIGLIGIMIEEAGETSSNKVYFNITMVD